MVRPCRLIALAAPKGGSLSPRVMVRWLRRYAPGATIGHVDTWLFSTSLSSDLYRLLLLVPPWFFSPLKIIVAHW
jgi:hypothetical protein